LIDQNDLKTTMSKGMAAENIISSAIFFIIVMKNLTKMSQDNRTMFEIWIDADSI
jgi:hypothetical protein